MSEKPRIIYENKEAEPRKVFFAELVLGKTYIAAENIRINMGEQDSARRSSKQDIASMLIPAGTEFLVDAKSSSTNSYKKIIFKNGLEIFLVYGCFPKEEISVFEKNEDVNAFN